MSKKLSIPRKKRVARLATIAVDFDGVLADPITREPLPLALDSLRALSNKNIKIIIFSARAATEIGKQSIINWLRFNGVMIYDVVAVKPVADVYIDDRAVYHTDWGNTMTQVGLRLGINFV